MGNSPPPWAAYRAPMAYRLVALDKRPGVSLVGIGETLHQASAKLVMRAAGDQANMYCRRLQLCAGLEANIKGATHAVAQMQRERNVLVPEEGGDKDLEDERMATEGGA